MKEFIFKLNTDDQFSIDSSSSVEVDLTSKDEYKHTFFNKVRLLYKMPNFFQNEALDLWYISLMVYYVDRKVIRSGTFDNWTRQMKLYIPVLELDKWNNNKDLLIKMISYLSGDIWDFDFRKRELNEKESKISATITKKYVTSKYKPDHFCMLSGGLDVCLQKKVYFFLGSVFDFLKVDKKVISVKFLEL